MESEDNKEMDRPASAGADNEEDDDYELSKRNKSNNEDDEENSSTENYEPLDFKSWRRPSGGNEEEEEEEEEDYPARASLTVELGPATSSSARLAADTSALVAGIRTAK